MCMHVCVYVCHIREGVSETVLMQMKVSVRQFTLKKMCQQDSAYMRKGVSETVLEI